MTWQKENIEIFDFNLMNENFNWKLSMRKELYDQEISYKSNSIQWMTWQKENMEIFDFNSVNENFNWRLGLRKRSLQSSKESFKVIGASNVPQYHILKVLGIWTKPIVFLLSKSVHWSKQYIKLDF